ncbi:MAG: hypothetical protein IOC56_04405 [Methylobacterium sp.]|nr:hypothetical protein [Methylobacterium sp.]MCA3619360.1 hypothetical protein [Methylobacterium sp.]MCA3620311.1 hypothetical protein [Methylobacterium sp.]
MAINSEKPMPPKDLSDFILRWPEFRAIAEETRKDTSSDESKNFVIRWLIELADRVGPADIEVSKDQELS